jgi:hypothetical protein
MFNNKYNPDVLISYNSTTINNKNTKYELKNDPYNLIIKDKNIMITHNKLSIETKEVSEKDILDKYNLIFSERNIIPKKKLSKKNIELIKKQFKLKNAELFNIEDNIPENHDEMKIKFKSDFINEEESIKSDRMKYNNILDSLLDEGLLD